MPIDWATVDVNILSNNRVVLAASGVSAALNAQSYRVALIRDNQDMGFTNGSPTVTWASANAADAGDQLVDENAKRPYRILSVSAGVSYTLTEDWTGTTGTHAAHIFAGAAAGANPIDPSNGGIQGDKQ